MPDVRALQRTTRQSPYKMRLVVDQIRGKNVNEALALLQFSKKHAAREIAKVLQSAVANAEYRGRTANEPIDVDLLYIKHAVINEGPKLKRFMPAAMGRATPIQKRTSHVEIVVAPRAVPVADRLAPRASGASRAPSATKRSAASAASAERTTKARTRNPKRGQ
jgi:large subunit ribosomal protein L22